jgi:hypothetical protein
MRLVEPQIDVDGGDPHELADASRLSMRIDYRKKMVLWGYKHGQYMLSLCEKGSNTRMRQRAVA